MRDSIRRLLIGRAMWYRYIPDVVFAGYTASSFQVQPAGSLHSMLCQLVCARCSSRLPHLSVGDIVARAERLIVFMMCLCCKESCRITTKPRNADAAIKDMASW